MPDTRRLSTLKTTSQGLNHALKEPQELDELNNDENRITYANELIIYHINDTDLDKCPHVGVLIGNELITLVIDSGVEA